MRLKIKLHALERNIALPLNYQYPLSAWIYRVLEMGDPIMAQLLHEEGYVEGKRRFKFYSFGELRCTRQRIEKDRLILLHPELSFNIHFLAEQAAQTMIMGLFKATDAFFLGDKVSGGRFAVSSVEIEMLPQLGESLQLFSVSPVVISTFNAGTEGRNAREYHSPLEPGYGELLLGNLQRKFEVAQAAGLVGGDMGEPGFQLLSNEAKEKKIDLMPGTPHYTRVRGYKFRFELKGSPEFLKLALLAGVGEKNAMGFGGVEEVKNERS
jgi:CRISPR-associated endoribonuclease Cas6